MSNAENPLNPPDDAAETAAPGTAPAGATDAGQKLAELEARDAEVSGAYLRAKGEAENARRRADEEISKARKFAVEAFAESLLPVKDSREAAIAQPDAQPAQILEGV